MGLMVFTASFESSRRECARRSQCLVSYSDPRAFLTKRRLSWKLLARFPRRCWLRCCLLHESTVCPACISPMVPIPSRPSRLHQRVFPTVCTHASFRNLSSMLFALPSRRTFTTLEEPKDMHKGRRTKDKGQRTFF